MKASIAVATAANKISETGQRAWIAIESVKLVYPTVIPNLELVPRPENEEARRTRLIIQVSLRNIGHSPASQLKVSCNILEPVSSELYPHVPQHVQFAGHRRGEGGSVVLPDDREYRTFEFWGPLPRDCFVDMPSPHFLIALEVCATYRISTDPNGHKTQFAYRDEVVARGLPKGDEISLARDGKRDYDPT